MKTGTVRGAALALGLLVCMGGAELNAQTNDPVGVVFLRNTWRQEGAGLANLVSYRVEWEAHCNGMVLEDAFQAGSFATLTFEPPAGTQRAVNRRRLGEWASGLYDNAQASFGLTLQSPGRFRAFDSTGQQVGDLAWSIGPNERVVPAERPLITAPANASWDAEGNLVLPVDATSGVLGLNSAAFANHSNDGVTTHDRLYLMLADVTDLPAETAIHTVQVTDPSALTSLDLFNYDGQGSSIVADRQYLLVLGYETRRIGGVTTASGVLATATPGENHGVEIKTRLNIVFGEGTGGPPPAAAWDAGHQTIGGGWRRLEWFGDYVPMGVDTWIWHGRHGFFFVAANATANSSWLYAQDMGWMWTGDAVYPFLYRDQDGSWLWYNGSTNPRWFMNFTTGGWESWD